MRFLRPIFSAPMMHRLSSPWRLPLSFMASAAPRWWKVSPLPTRRVSPLMVSPDPPVRRVSRFPWEPRNMTTITRAKGKPSRQLPTYYASANVIIPPKDNKHSAINQGVKNIDNRGTISKIITGDEKSEVDACSASTEVLYVKYDRLGQTDGCGEEDGRRETEEHRGRVVLSDNKEAIHDEEYAIYDILPESRHRDGSIYRDVDSW